MLGRCPVPTTGRRGERRYRSDMTDEELMGLALEQARVAGAIGEVPVGAVVVVDGEVVAAAHNRRQADSDPSAHAELLALRAACAAAGSWRLPGAQVVVTLEPCPMCAGALVAARVDRVVFGAPDPKAGAMGSLYNLGADPRLPHELEVRAGVRVDECGELLRSFFVDRRPGG
jgi:tRNA(adenine34) deaminase